MSRFKLVQIDSTVALRRSSDTWDDLWWRSNLALPTARARLLAQWLEEFASGRRFIALGIEKDDCLLAALPLVEARIAGTLRVGQMPVSPWSSSGDLLVDPLADVDVVLDHLALALKDLPWALLWLDYVEAERSEWRELLAAVRRARLPLARRRRFHIGQIHMDQEWESYQKRWSKNHRRNIRKCMRRLEAQGEVALKVFPHLHPDEVESRLVQGFEIEDRNWKGRTGTSVLRTPGMLDFYLRQARQLAEWNQLELLFLELNGKPIAFEFGCRAKGVYFSHKVGYDDAYAHLSPGQLLMRYQLELYHSDPNRSIVDSMGVLNEASAKWATHAYPMERLVIGTGGPASTLFMRGYIHVWPKIRQLRNQVLGGMDECIPPKLGAAKSQGNSSESEQGSEVEIESEI